jgi:hypothetical protein
MIGSLFYYLEHIDKRFPKEERFMNSVTINGNEYKIPELDFNTVCELEDNGISLLAMDQRNPKIATMLRAFCAWIMRTTPERASEEIQAHIQNGGNIMELFAAITSALENSGFSKGNRRNSTTKFPQDHKRRRNHVHVKNESGKNTEA